MQNTSALQAMLKTNVCWGRLCDKPKENLHRGGYGIMGFKGMFLLHRPPVKIHLDSKFVPSIQLKSTYI